MVSIDSCRASSMKAQVLTTTRSAAAVGDVRAAGCDPVRRGFDNAHDRAPVGSVTAADLDLDQLAGEGSIDQHDLPVVPPRQRRTAGDQALDPHDLRHAGSLRER